MSSRRVVLAAAGGGAVALAGLFVTRTFDDALRAVGARPRPLPRAEDSSLLRAVVKDQQAVHAVAVAVGVTEAAALVAAQLEQLGAGTGDRVADSTDLASTLRDAAAHRATDARAAISPQFAQVLASMSAGLTQAVTWA